MIGGEGDWGPRGKGAGVPIREGLVGAGIEGLGSLGEGGGSEEMGWGQRGDGLLGKGVVVPGTGGLPGDSDWGGKRGTW